MKQDLNLAYYKGVVVKLQTSLKHENIQEFRSDIAAAVRFAKARVKLLERKAGITGESLWKNEKTGL